MTRLALKWALNSCALFFVMKLVQGVQISRFQDLLMATVVIGLLNAFLRPIIVLLTLPVTVLTLGLFTLVINGVIFYLAAYLVPGFHVAGFASAVIAAFLFSLFSFTLNMVFGTK
ncbi:MAG TPA: phage holin family protein [Desulfuromonadales bacterium]|nr:phage holin family protein [Desulfuromonadales bacterium]